MVSRLRPVERRRGRTAGEQGAGCLQGDTRWGRAHGAEGWSHPASLWQQSVPDRHRHAQQLLPWRQAVSSGNLRRCQIHRCVSGPAGNASRFRRVLASRRRAWGASRGGGWGKGFGQASRRTSRPCMFRNDDSTAIRLGGYEGKVPRMKRWIERALNIQPGDLGRGILLCSCLFLIISSYVTGRVARDALFLARFQAVQLPYADIANAVLVGIVVVGYVRLGRMTSLRNLLVGSQFFFATNCVLFWALAHYYHPGWLYPAFYVWVGLFGVLAPTQVWTLANYLLTTREAKRIFGMVGGGAILGAIFAGYFSKTIAKAFGAESLLLGMASLLFICTVLMATMWHSWKSRLAATSETAAGDKGIGQRDLQGSMRLVLSSPYLRAIAAVICLASFVTTLTGWQFKAVAKQFLVNKDALAIALKGSDQVLRYSLDKSAVELLYLPLPHSLKLRAKWFIDTVVWRLGDGLAGVTVLIFATYLHVAARQISWIALLLVGAWFVAVSVGGKQYIATLKESISQHRLTADQASALALDRSTMDLLASKILASDPEEILYALSLFEVERQRAAHPVIRGLLNHPAPKVRQKAISVLSAAGDKSVLPSIEPLLKDPDHGVRTEAMLYLVHHAHVDPLTLLAELGDCADFSVRSAVAAYLARPGEAQSLETSRQILTEMSSQDGEECQRTRVEVARLLGGLPDSFDPLLATLLS